MSQVSFESRDESFNMKSPVSHEENPYDDGTTVIIENKSIHLDRRVQDKLSNQFKKMSGTGLKISALSKMERNRLKSYLADRYNGQIAQKIINYLKIPANITFEEYMMTAQQFFRMKQKRYIELAFQVHDFNNDGVVDVNDTYDLLYVGKMLKTDADYLMTKDVIAIKEALNKKNVKARKSESAEKYIRSILPEVEDSSKFKRFYPNQLAPKGIKVAPTVDQINRQVTRFDDLLL